MNEYLVIKASEGIRGLARGYLLYWTRHNASGILTYAKVDSWKVYRTVKETKAVAVQKNPNAIIYSERRDLL